MEKFESSFINLKDLLHPRVVEFCIPLFNNGHFKQAASESFIHIEHSLKQKLPYYENQFTRGLVNFAYKGKKHKLKIPYSEDLQKKAHDYFDSVFAYYRNYLAHEVKQIDIKNCIRILIISSELLDMIDASIRPFKGIETVDDLIKSGIFEDRKKFLTVLEFLEGTQFIDEVYDGFFEDMYIRDISEDQYESMMDNGLIEYKCHGVIQDIIFGVPTDLTFDTLELTDLGAFIKKELIEASENSFIRKDDKKIVENDDLPF